MEERERESVMVDLIFAIRYQISCLYGILCVYVLMELSLID